MSNLADHEAEQARITAACEADPRDIFADTWISEFLFDDIDSTLYGEPETRPVPVAVAFYDPATAEAYLCWAPGYAPHEAHGDIIKKDIAKDILAQAESDYLSIQLFPTKD